ncbi:hypothetical protein T02_14860 [Trichinella nativa]|uniref:Uncharacterized protein n=1 Tax=Trichinella nativa TaxID=6335 RepID=A0A0V1KLL0_9BILA|nr:hypothetical protein T02_14860 [Trichinella nativa]
MMLITRFLLANCKIGNVDELCLRKLKNSETLMEVGSVDVDRVNHFYDFTCEGVIQILPSCYWFLFQWLTFHHDAVLCSIAEEQTRLDNSGVGMLSNVEWFVVEPNVFSPVACHYPQFMKVSGRFEGPSESSEFFSVSEYLKLMNLGSASVPNGVKGVPSP